MQALEPAALFDPEAVRPMNPVRLVKGVADR
ncbi:hypothetical protein SAMN04489717_1205 [Actinopolymorpha singaporensis]|uniref:Uncharacterized protein n=1 Tax=Actinopolymorpha singaporensis TaxID=117157 RepID=A0A1H1NG65_9ACTN|nr:hypothetical protein SAMN04489717_1205 [Actinopolymorpha singaporensis]